MGAVFTYQGRLNDRGAPANGSYDLRFALFDASTSGSQIGVMLTNPAVVVSNGLFSAALDFGGSVFTGDARWLEIAVRTNSGSVFTTLTPRQPLTTAPYALYAPSAGWAWGATTANGVAAGAVENTSLQNGAVTSAKIAAGGVVASNVNAATFGTTFWKTDGNSGTTGGTHFLGTTDNQTLELRVNNTRALRLVWNANAPIITGGGSANQATGAGAVICGGNANTAMPMYSFLGGGVGNTVGASANYSTLVGGDANAIQSNADHASIGGGGGNNILAGADYSAIPGGYFNTAGGNFALAAGQRAKALHTGAFVWADSTADDFASTSTNQFLIRAAGGVGIGTNNPQSALHVQGTVTATAFSGSFNAVNGMVIENRTSDPPSPAVGQIWLRTDL